MTRYIRLGYLIPRLVLLVVLYCLAEIGSGYALRWAVVSQGERALGAKVEVGRSVVSLIKTQIALSDVRVANPQRPMENLLEADRLELDFESDSLLRRSAVAERGVVRGLRFGTPRETSGELDPEQTPEAGGLASSWLAGAETTAATTADRWLEDLQDKLSGEATDFESVRLAEQLARDWPARYDALATEARSVGEDMRQLRDAAEEARNNPLRHAEFLRDAPRRLSELRGRLRAIRGEFAALPARVAEDRSRVEQARLADERRLRERLQVDQLDPQSLSSVLLGESVTGSVGELVSWVRWMREMVPASKPSRANTPRSRGVDVHFVGVKQRPDLLIRELQLAGTTRLGGRAVELAGVVTDFTTSPARHNRPMQLTLSTHGAVPMEIRAKVDRTGDTPVDELFVDCPAFDLPGTRVGDTDRFAFVLADSLGALNVSVKIDGDRLSGDLQLVQERVAFSSQAGPRASALARRLSDELASRVSAVNKPAVRVTLAGTLDEPRTAIWSSLGPAVAQSLEESAKGVVQEEVEGRLAGLNRRLSGQMASFDQLVNDASGRLLGEIQAPEQAVQSLADRWLGGGLGENFPLQRLGERLPLGGSLFK